MSQLAPRYKHFYSVDHALFQASMWRKHAACYGGWEITILKATREECLAKAREAIEAARHFNALKVGDS